MSSPKRAAGIWIISKPPPGKTGFCLEIAISLGKTHFSSKEAAIDLVDVQTKHVCPPIDEIRISDACLASFKQRLGEIDL